MRIHPGEPPPLRPRAPRPRVPRRRVGDHRRLVAVAAVLIAACVATLGGMLIYAAAPLPALSALAVSTGSVRILDRHGELIAEIARGGVSRRSVKLSQVAPVMRDATLAAEDRNFYHEGAFDYGRVLKALLVDTVARRPEQGASTITQQLAKNAILSSHGGGLRHLREAMLAPHIAPRDS